MPHSFLRSRIAHLALAGLTLAGTVSLAAPAFAANHPERQWMVKDSAHFAIHYYPGIEHTAMRILRDAEDAYPKISADFGNPKFTGRIPIILTQDSFFNGEAEPVKDRILLDPLLANSSIVGTQRFVAHELTHVINFRAMDPGNKVAELSAIGGVPRWFLEGLAQYCAEYWYPGNDRMLRLHTLEHKLMTDTERENFPMLGEYAGAEGYDEGYSLCRYIFDTYGRDKIPVLMANLRDGKHTFDQAIAATCGVTMPAIEAGWKQGLKTGYAKQIRGMQAAVPGATKLVDSYQGEVNVEPRVSPDGKHLAYLTSRYQDGFLYLRGQVMGFLSLYLADPDGRNAHMLPVGKGVVTNIHWSPDSKQILYSRVVADAYGNPSYDLYVYDLATQQTTRLTDGENTNQMAWRPGSSQVVYVSIQDGHNTIKLIDTHTKKITTLLDGKGDQQFREPAFSPDGSQLALVTYQPGQMGSLGLVDPDSGKLRMLTAVHPRIEDANPTWTPDGRAIVYSSDRGGMSNLYRIAVATGAREQLTDTFRGAEYPALSPDGKEIYFTSYRAEGSVIYRMPLGQGVPLAASAPTRPARPPLNAKPLTAMADSDNGATGLQAAPALVGAPGESFLSSSDKHLHPNTYTIQGAKRYKATLTNDFLMPEVTQDEKGEQVGLTGTYSDILDMNQLAFDVRYGLMSQRFAYLLEYINRMSLATWMVSLYDQPQIALAPDVATSSEGVYNSLYFQRRRGAAFDIQAPLGAGRALTGGLNFGTLSTLEAPLSGASAVLKEGQLNTISLGYSEQHLSNTIDADINPTNGYRLALGATMSDHNLGSAFNFAQYNLSGERYFAINPELRQNLTWRFNLGWINGDAVMPFLLGGATESDPIYELRGYAVGAVSGNRLATTGLEYTAPIFQHIDKQFGPLYLDRLYVAGFTDVGSAWTAGQQPNPYASAGLEFRLRTLVGGQNLTLRFGLAKKLGSSDWPGFYLTF